MTPRILAASVAFTSATLGAEPTEGELDSLRQQVQTLEVALTHLQEVVQSTQSQNYQLAQKVQQLEQKVEKTASLPTPQFHAVSTPAPDSPAPSAAGSYRVKSGDTLWRIARRNKVSLAALRKANPGLEPKRLRIGQALTIPGAGTATKTVRKSKPAPAPRRQAASTPSRPLPQPRNLPRLTSTAQPESTSSQPRERKRIITLTRDRRFSYIAELYGTDIATLNRINNLNLSANKLIQAGSSLYILH